MSKDKVVDRALKAKYGITLAEYEKQLKKQNGVCAICGRPPKSRRLNVDHNHATGQIRGLLDFFCNKFVIGREMVTAEMHRRAAAYLDSPPWEFRFVPEFVPEKEKKGGKHLAIRRSRRPLVSRNSKQRERRRARAYSHKRPGRSS